MAQQRPEEVIRSLEDERGRALLAADWNALDVLIAADLVHIHANGAIEDRLAYFEGVRNKLEFVRFERESYLVRANGDTAIATGILRQTVRTKGPSAVFEMRIATTQVWIRAGGRWMQTSFQATNIP